MGVGFEFVGVGFETEGGGDIPALIRAGLGDAPLLRELGLRGAGVG